MENLNRLMELPRTGEAAIGTAWHYTNRAGLESILGSHTIWASDATTMNDPLELETGHLAIQDALIRAQLPRDIEAGVRSHLDFARGVMDRGKTFVLSASSNGDSIAQWIAYGENLEGYAIGFQVPREALSLLERHPFDPEADPDGHGDINQYVSVWRDVLYDTSAQAAEADAFVDLLARLVDPAAYDARMAGYSFNELLVLAYAPRGYAGIVTRLKRHSWVHEQEVRITATALDASRFHETSPAGRSHVTLTGFVRPASITGTSSFTSALPTPLPMVAVRAGPKCPHSDLRALLDANGYDKTDAHRSEVAYR